MKARLSKIFGKSDKTGTDDTRKPLLEGIKTRDLTRATATRQDAMTSVPDIRQAIMQVLEMGELKPKLLGVKSKRDRSKIKDTHYESLSNNVETVIEGFKARQQELLVLHEFDADKNVISDTARFRPQRELGPGEQYQAPQDFTLNEMIAELKNREGNIALSAHGERSGSIASYQREAQVCMRAMIVIFNTYYPAPSGSTDNPSGPSRINQG